MKHLVNVTQLMGINEVEIILLDNYSRVSYTALYAYVVFCWVLIVIQRSNFIWRELSDMKGPANIIV